jgi:Ohr subfamily peroxiredoxin
VTVLYTARIRASGGRDGAARNSDDYIDVRLSLPGEAGDGTNPEQLFAADWSACFVGAMRIAAGRMRITVPAEVAIDAEVNLGITKPEYLLQARL